MHLVLECDRRTSAVGVVLRVQIERHDGAPMPWREVWDVFAERYPGRWALQAFPPVAELMDGANKYHLFVLEDGQRPYGLCL